MSIKEPNLRVRINQIDHTVEPAGPLDNTALSKVPVIRIYGETSVGKKACLHVHQVYPYFFVEYLGQMGPNDGEPVVSLNAVVTYDAVSERVYRETKPFVEPRDCIVIETESALNQLSVRARCSPSQGRALLWLSRVLLAIPQDSYRRPGFRQPSCNIDAFWYSHEDAIPSV